MLFCELIQFGVPLDVFCELHIFARLMASWSLGAGTGAVFGYVLFGVLFEVLVTLWAQFPRLPASARGHAVWGGGASAVLGCCLRCC